MTQTASGPYIFSEQSAQMCKAEYDKRGVKQYVDYAHASLMSYTPADPALAGAAAAHYDLGFDRDGNCYAENVKWTPRGSKMLEDGEYAYISPALEVKEDGTVVRVINCALTNRPATFKIEPLVELEEQLDSPVAPEKKTMTVKTFGAIAAVMQLSEGATDDQVVAGVAALHHERTELLTLTDSKNPGEALGKLRAWKDAAAKLVTLQAEVEKNAKAARAVEVDSVIDKAIADKKAVPAQKEALRTMGLQDIEQLKGFIAASPNVQPTPAKEPGKDTNPPAPEGGVLTLSADEKQAARALGFTEKEYAEHKATAVPPAERMKSNSARV